jgi:hypothetical protein
MKQSDEKHQKMTTSLAKEITGGLSVPSKMPGFSYNLPATSCTVGQKLRRVKGSVCSKCYALKGRYSFLNVKNAMARRLAGIDHPRWVEAMIFLIHQKSEGRGKHNYFRWHDSGDLQSKEHLHAIFRICRATPKVNHWLPTREIGILKGETPPENLTIRVSAFMIGEVIGEKFSASLVGRGIVNSAVLPLSKARLEREKANGETVPSGKRQTWICPATTDADKHECGECRACWKRKVERVIYAQH